MLGEGDVAEMRQSFSASPIVTLVGLDYLNRFEKNRASRDVIQLFVRLCLVADIILKPHSNNTF